MSLVVNCPSCAKPVRVPERLAGKKVRCPLCKTILMVPDAAQGEGEALPEPVSVEAPPDPLADLASAATTSQSRPFVARKAGWVRRVITASVMLAALAGAVALGVYLYKQHQQPVQVGSEWEIQNKARLESLNVEAANLADQGRKQEAFDKYDKLLEEFHRRALSDPEVIGVLESARQARRLLADEIAKGRATLVIRKPATGSSPAVAIATTAPGPSTQAIARADVPPRSPVATAPVSGPPRITHNTPKPATAPSPIPLASTATAPSSPQDEAARLKQLFDALLQQGTNALAAGEADAALETLFDARLVLDRCVKAKILNYNSPEHIALLHGLAIGYQLAEKPEKASPLFDENNPLDRAAKAENASRQLLITRGFLDATQGYLAMRTVVRVTEYIKKYPNRIDSDLMDVLISALVKADERVQNRALMLDPAIKLYEQYNAKLEATRPGKKRWGVNWVTPLEFEGERGRRDAAMREWQRQRQIVDQYATQVKQAEKELEAAKKGGVSARARTNAASEALAAVRRRMADAEKAAQEAKAQIPPIPTLTREDFRRLVAPSESEIARAGGMAPGDAQTQIVSAQALRLGGAEPKQATASPTPSPTPEAAPPATFESPVAAPASRRTFSRSVTGFAVGPDLILTTSVAAGARRVIIEFPNAVPAEGVVVRSNDELALIRVRDQTMSYLNLAEAFTGGPVQCPAYPDISIFGVNLQTLAGRANPPNDGALVVALPKHPRIPGSPLIDPAGNLVGVVTATRENPADRIPAATIEKITAFLATDLPKQTCATPRSAPIVQITVTFER